MEKYDAADVTFFTAGGPSPVGAHAADLKRLKASPEARLDNEPMVFPQVFPNLPFATYLQCRPLSCDAGFQQDAAYFFYVLETWFRKKKSAEQPLSLSPRETIRNKYRPTKKSYAVVGKVSGTHSWDRTARTVPDDAPDRAPRLLPHSDKPRETASCLGTVY